MKYERMIAEEIGGVIYEGEGNFRFWIILRRIDLRLSLCRFVVIVSMESRDGRKVRTG